MIVVLMGVSGSGKSTIGTLLAERTGATFADGDSYHSAAMKQKMAAGHPLDDDDRQPWLETLNSVMRGWFADAKSGVMVCSALKEKYRDTLASGMPKGTVTFVILEGSKELFAERMAHRHHEFMNPNLLDSQFATLETPKDAIHATNDKAPDVVVEGIIAQLEAQTKQ